YPLNGASSVDTSKAFSWTSVSGAQAYYLYVGTSQGAQDLVDSAEIQSTSYQVPPLPAGQTLWARIWTEVGGHWSFRDASFTAVAPSHSSFTYPQNGSTSVDTSKAFTWTSVPSAQAYYVYVGTAQGGQDLVDSGALSTSSTS